MNDLIARHTAQWSKLCILDHQQWPHGEAKSINCWRTRISLCAYGSDRVGRFDLCRAPTQPREMFILCPKCPPSALLQESAAKPRLCRAFCPLNLARMSRCAPLPPPPFCSLPLIMFSPLTLLLITFVLIALLGASVSLSVFLSLLKVTVPRTHGEKHSQAGGVVYLTRALTRTQSHGADTERGELLPFTGAVSGPR